MEPATPAPATLPIKGELAFHFIKSNQFRVIYADGVYGGISPKKLIRMAFFNERSPIPTKVVHETEINGMSITVKDEKERISRDGYVREIESEIIMNLETAKSVSLWLTKIIQQLEELK